MADRKVTDDELIAALKEGSDRAAARALGINPRTLTRRKKALALKGYSPEHHMTRHVPDGFLAKGVSTYYNGDGVPRGQWVIARQDAEQVRRMIDGIMAGLCAEIPREKPQRAPKQSPDGLLAAYIVTDYHLGMLAWGEETGADWDTQIAEDMLVAWFAQAMAETPDTEVGLFAQLGDFMHWDGWDAVTPTSRHILDADSRFPKLVRVASRAIKRIIRMMLQKHLSVRVIMAEGNHDMASSVWLRQLVEEMFVDEPRVYVDMRPDPYYCVEHGRQLLLFHHGHKRRLDGIDRVFAGKFREEFGRALFVNAHMGHLHHAHVKETELMTVEQHRTLAASDAHASRGGYLSERDAQVIVYCSRYGERMRRRIPAQLIIDQAA